MMWSDELFKKIFLNNQREEWTRVGKTADRKQVGGCGNARERDSEDTDSSNGSNI